MKLTIVGCGDAFGAGGRLNTCFHAESGSTVFLIDCGATALIGLKRLGLDPNAIQTIFISHLHGDHFGGLCWFLIDGQHVSKRQVPLTVVGPAGIEDRVNAATEALFPRASQIEKRYALNFVELRDKRRETVADVSVTPYEVLHFSGAPPYALRFDVGGKIISYSGDTEWVENLIPAAQGSSLFIAECSQFDVQLKFHLDYLTLAKNAGRLAAKRILLTHMGDAMLARLKDIDRSVFEAAEDGMVLNL